ncbi:MAG: hypothetical protein ABL964_16335 [Steroidobacteraceae bacterium]
MSAFCCMNGVALMRSDRTLPHLLAITARPSQDEKQRFAALAASRQLSESALALIAIRALLDSHPSQEQGKPPTKREPAADRITIRLRPGDRRAINERAARRGLKASAYLAGLVRAHIAANPPLAADELAAVKHAVAVLAALGRLLAQVSRGALQAGTPPTELLHSLNQTRTVVAALEQRTSALARAALMSWESRYD